jgi:hypothetical protein
MSDDVVPPESKGQSGPARISGFVRAHISWAGLFSGLYLVTRLVLALRHPAERFGDSGGYTWNGTRTVRPYGISVLFDALGTDTRIVVVQTLLASFGWIWLFHELRNALSPARRANVIATLVALVTLSGPIRRWDRLIISEALVFGILAALAAAWLSCRRRGFDARSLTLAASLIVAAALLRETVFLAMAVPLGIAITVSLARRAWPHATSPSARLRLVVAPAIASAVILAALGAMALKPSSVIYEEHGAALTSFRNMNVIGQRILTDDYLRRRMESAGLPDTSADPTLRSPRFAMDDDWKLFRNPRLVAYARHFPVFRYLVAQSSRPRTFAKTTGKAFDRSVYEGTKGYGSASDELVAAKVGLFLWGWTSVVHVGFFGLALAGALALRTTLTDGSRSVIFGGLSLTVIMGAAAAFALLLDAMEVPRHVLPFWAFGRLALVVVLAVVVVESLRRSGRRGSPGSTRTTIVRTVLLGTLGVAGAVGVWRFTFDHAQHGPTLQAKRASTALVRDTERQLRASGVMLSPSVRQVLPLLLAPWESRDDLKNVMTSPDGSPNIAVLSAWARALPDAATEGLLPHLGALEELRGRMSVLSSDTGIGPVLYWTLKNEPRLDQDFSGVIWHLVDLWKERPPVAEGFTTDGKVDVLGFLKFSDAVGSDDPYFGHRTTDTVVVNAAIAALENHSS